ncbi:MULTISPECIES: RNA methyltransferase [unclassified Arthrobacter]|uniref:TrmH family RNA methyltransferase n=1 Tax=unclassified Arthrobacter TaxID=235627 RepID=UPI001E5C0AEB|nr:MULTISPECIES: RNA methyltransferase [unclassified Arthrobacter]MCC9146318.1 RNA methyltransferase [Arthrobacter sp. zg-Y919]MDK1277548.1 RNA methyltransferase [Arthrobacter sp. zg.Y919]WIB04031.1 RNA methyltransferase [Arthrobacter sp. zg-Y919]
MNLEGRPQAPLMSNPRADRVRDTAKLAGRSSRLKTGRFLAEGPQAVREALSAHRAAAAGGGPAVVHEVYATQACLDRLPELADLARGVTLRLATDEVLAAMADTVSPQGIIAVCHTSTATLEDVLASGAKLIAVLCEVRDPGNAGTVLRAADSAGADAVVLTASSVDIYNPKAVRSTAGSLFHLPVVTGAEFTAVIDALHAAGVTVLAADGYGNVNLDRLQDLSAVRRFGTRGDGGSEALSDDGMPRLEAATAWLFGNEAQGLSDAELAAADHRVAVPLYGRAESLNVGTAATVCLYASARAQNG